MLSPFTWLSGRRLLATLLASQVAQAPVHAYQLDYSDRSSLEHAASQTEWAAMSWYGGNETGAIPGAFPEKWWEGAALFHSALQYWYTTGDTTYNDIVKKGMQHQAGKHGNYMPSNYSSFLGYDDQVFWGLAAMSAAEWKLEDVPDGYSWLSLAQGVFNYQSAAWDETKCGGGLRWQMFPYQAGYVIKNSISNGGFFQLAARLARYTHNATYAEWAEKTWDWSVDSLLVNTKTWNVGDTVNINDNCTSLGNLQWSYNYGTYLAGAAYMQAYTNGTVPKWTEAVEGLLGETFKRFFPEKFGGNTISEVTCEPKMICDNNQILFKGYVSSWLALTGLLLPKEHDKIKPRLKGSAISLAESCDGMGNNTCGVRWWPKQWDGWNGMEEQISAACGFSSNLLLQKGKSPVTTFTGGNSTSNPNAGSGGGGNRDGSTLEPITTGDKAGAGILTAFFIPGWVALMAWMVLGG